MPALKRKPTSNGGPEHPSAFYSFARWTVYFVFRLWSRLEIRGRENVPMKGPLLVAANHASYTDPPLVGCAVPRVLHFLAKKELFRFKPFALLISSLNAHPLNRSAGAGALKAAEELFRVGYAVIMFPEGKRVKGGELGPPKPGLGLLALRSNVPVLPVYLHNSNKAIFMKKVTISIGKPLHFEGEREPRDVGKKVMDAISALKEEVKREE